MYKNVCNCSQMLLRKMHFFNKMPSKIKRLPYNSYSIILKFENVEDRDKCIQSEEFENVFGKLASKTQIKYGCKIESIKN